MTPSRPVNPGRGFGARSRWSSDGPVCGKGEGARAKSNVRGHRWHALHSTLRPTWCLDKMAAPSLTLRSDHATRSCLSLWEPRDMLKAGNECFGAITSRHGIKRHGSEKIPRGGGSVAVSGLAPRGPCRAARAENQGGRRPRARLAFPRAETPGLLGSQPDAIP